MECHVPVFVSTAQFPLLEAAEKILTAAAEKADPMWVLFFFSQICWWVQKSGDHQLDMKKRHKEWERLHSLKLTAKASED